MLASVWGIKYGAEQPYQDAFTYPPGGRNFEHIVEFFMIKEYNQYILPIIVNPTYFEFAFKIN